MSPIRLYIDEDASERLVVDGLIRSNIDVLTTANVDALGESDESQLAFATSQGRIFYTLNVADFARLHREWLAAGRSHAGVIVIPRQRYSASEKLRKLIEFLQRTTAEEMINRLEFI